ncbi:MAG: iron-sulfur cluster assembly accessory protein [Deltaproteobacteria bacterium]|nr:iron-sulfur cluster assembly accessory protein [Deltaproteobacteria bacterium]
MSEILAENGQNDSARLDLTVTDGAVQQVRRLLARDNRVGHGLRISISDGGCSGYSYKLDFEKEKKSSDIVLRFDGLEVFVDAQSAGYLKGTVIDFSSGIYGGGFKFTNPNATGTCGCGTSFSA